jgi:hypothetical protein
MVYPVRCSHQDTKRLDEKYLYLVTQVGSMDNNWTLHLPCLGLYPSLYFASTKAMNSETVIPSEGKLEDHFHASVISSD